MRLTVRLLILLLLGVSAWVRVRYYYQQNRLYAQLAQLTAVLNTENEKLARSAEYTIKGIQANVARNRRQPAEVAVLRRAEEVLRRTKQLMDTLKASDNRLRLTTGNAIALLPLRRPQAPAGAMQQAIRQHILACLDTLYQLAPTTAAQTARPAFTEDTPVVETLAELSQLESRVLASQIHSLKSLAGLVSDTTLKQYLQAAATAESNTVAPGDTYRAQLLVLANSTPTRAPLSMTCNGQSIPVGPTGIGQVRFRAPTRPGPATWTGTIRFNMYGRDTTFKVVVPYRVARR
jgi:cell division protein FtsB